MRTIALLLACLFAARASAADTSGGRPNIVLIMADDMGYSDVGCYGGDIRTPNIDSLARDDMRFSQFYNCAKCTTTRECILTGTYPRTTSGPIGTDKVTIAEVLRAAGYHTSLSGKWHMGWQSPNRPFDRGFEEAYGLLDGCCNYFNPAQPDPQFKGGKVRHFGHNDQIITEFPRDFYTTDAFTTHAIETIKRFHADGKPFFAHITYNSPHYPLHAPPEDIARYVGKYMMGWEEMRRQRHARQLEMGLLDPKWALSPTDSKAYDWSGANQKWEDLRMATYAAMVDRMDQNIGRVLATLRELKIEDNTVVMFLSDNGGCPEEPGGRDDTQQPGIVSTYTAVGPSWGWAQNTPFRKHKADTHEGGISTPLIVRWPGHVAPGSMTHQVGHIVDMLATCAEIAGAPYPTNFNGHAIMPIEGASLLPVFKGETRPAPAQLAWDWSGSRAIREGKWKAINDQPANGWGLYDMEADRTELHDLSKQNPERLNKMIADWTAWAQKTNPNLLKPGKKKKGDD